MFKFINALCKFINENCDVLPDGMRINPKPSVEKRDCIFLFTIPSIPSKSSRDVSGDFLNDVNLAVTYRQVTGTRLEESTDTLLSLMIWLEDNIEDFDYMGDNMDAIEELRCPTLEAIYTNDMHDVDLRINITFRSYERRL